MEATLQAVPVQLGGAPQPGPVAFLVPAPPGATAPQATGAAGAAISGRPAVGGLTAWTAWGCAAAVAAVSRRARRRSARCATAAVEVAGERLEEGAAPGRASLLRGLGASCAGALALPGAPRGVRALSVNEAKNAAANYGVPDLVPSNTDKALPDGWRVVVEPIGLAKDAAYGRFNLGDEPLVVEFYVPSGWIVTKPNYDFNGSAGTVSANDYGKGDSATLFVNTKPKVPIADMKKKDYIRELKKAITQKGAGAIDDVKIVKFGDMQDGYRILQFDWEIYSGAGLLLSRSGWASFCQVGDAGNLQVLWSGVVSNRWERMNQELKVMADSFRVGKIPKATADKYSQTKEREDDPARGII